MVEAVPEKLANFIIDESQHSSNYRVSTPQQMLGRQSVKCWNSEVKRGQENGVAEYVIWTSRTIGMRSPIRYPPKRRVVCKFCCAKFFV